jgi:uncharacterized coiled-coil protein SlyX
MDTKCGIPFTYYGVATQSVAASQPTSVACDDAVYRYSNGYTSAGLPSFLAGAPYTSMTHYRNFTTCNFAGQLKLQSFSCPLPDACDKWLRSTCGAGTCVVDYSSLEYWNLTARSTIDAGVVELPPTARAETNLNTTVTAQQITIDTLSATVAAQQSTIDALGATVTAQQSTIDALGSTVAAQAADLVAILTRLDALEGCCSQSSFVPAKLDPCKEELAEADHAGCNGLTTTTTMTTTSTTVTAIVGVAASVLTIGGALTGVVVWRCKTTRTFVGRTPGSKKRRPVRAATDSTMVS